MQVKTKIKKLWFNQREKFPLKHYFSEYQWQKSVDEESSNEEIIKDVLKLNPLLLVETTFPLIRVSNQVIECDSAREIGEVDRYSHSFGVFFDGKISNFTRLTGLDISEYGIKDDPNSESIDYEQVCLTNELNDSKIYLKMHDFNRFTGEFTLIGNFDGVYDDYDILLYNKLFVKATFWGIPSNINSPAWIEYLIDATINYMNGDHKMAALSYFSAYENFVSTIHDQFIFERYARRALKTTEEFTEARKFAQNRKRLAAKSTDVAKYLDMFDDDLKRVINKLSGYADKRNEIAHGTTTTLNFDVVDMAYHILVYMYTVGYREKVLQNDWKGIIKTNT
ncbi:hypothetical protein [Vibrio harveyi]|uniref:hypothetical protein n=1 Tax=Vibrio harveyi TaxID=669 RepID=UPI0018F13E24|nr:hypothetical protein [Vibrio harveyi]